MYWHVRRATETYLAVRLDASAPDSLSEQAYSRLKDVPNRTYSLFLSYKSTDHLGLGIKQENLMKSRSHSGIVPLFGRWLVTVNFML